MSKSEANPADVLPGLDEVRAQGDASSAAEQGDASSAAEQGDRSSAAEVSGLGAIVEADSAFPARPGHHYGRVPASARTTRSLNTPHFSRMDPNVLRQIRSVKSGRTGTASTDDFRLPYETRLNRELFIQHIPEVSPIRLRTILPGVYAQPPATAGVGGTMARPPRPFPLNAPGASCPQKVMYVKPCEIKTAQNRLDEFRMFTTERDSRHTDRWVHTLENSEEAELDQQYLLRIGENAKADADKARMAAWKESRKMGTHDWREESFRWYIEQCDRRKRDAQYCTLMLEMEREEENKQRSLVEQNPSKTKSSLMSKPEKPRSVNVAKARRNALEQIMSELIEPIDNIPTQGLLLVPIKKKEKKHDVRVRKMTGHDHHQQAGVLSPGSGIATFPASPLPQTSTQSRSQNFRRESQANRLESQYVSEEEDGPRTPTSPFPRPKSRISGQSDQDGSDLGSRTMNTGGKVQDQDVGDPMTAWGFIQPLNANGKVDNVGALKAEKKRERRRSHSETVDKKKLTIVTDLAHQTLDAMPIKGRKAERLGRRQTTQLDASGMPMGVVLQRAQSQETAAQLKKDKLATLEDHYRAGSWREDEEHQKWLQTLARRKKHGTGVEKSMKKLYKQFKSVVHIINRRQYMAGWAGGQGGPATGKKMPNPALSKFQMKDTPRSSFITDNPDSIANSTKTPAKLRDEKSSLSILLE